MNGDLKDKFLGCMLGSALGDAIGAPFEFMDRASTRAKFRMDGLENFKGKYTDDTQLTLALARALLEDEAHFQEAFGREIVKWLEKGDNRYPGLTCLNAAQNLKEGIAPDKSGISNSLGSGAAMRIWPVGLLYDKNSIMLPAKKSSEITHANPCIYTSSSVIAYSVSELKKILPDDFHPAIFIDDLIEHAELCERDVFGKYKVNFSDILKKMKSAFPSQKFVDETQNRGACTDTVPLAIYCFLLNPCDFKKAVSESVKLGLDADTSACITGGLSGTLNGVSALPEEPLKKLEDKEYISKLASELFERYRRLKNE